jgi:beta-lactamase class A
MEMPATRTIKIILSGIICALLFFCIFFLIFILKAKKNTQVLGENTFTIRQNIEKMLHLKKTFLKDAVDASLSGSKGTYAVAIVNLETGESYSINEHKVFGSASLYKLWVMGTAYEEIQQGKLDPNEVLSDSVEDLNAEFNIATDEAELTEGTETFTVNDALTQMITISHNYAAMLLTRRLGAAQIVEYMKREGFNESTLGSFNGQPSTTAHDAELFFEKLYHGELANKKYTDEMMTLLKNQQLNGKIPENLPENTVIAHKTGELNDYSHDAGIVFLPENDYIIVVLSQSDYPPGAVERIAQISKAVYTYFNEEK